MAPTPDNPATRQWPISHAGHTLPVTLGDSDGRPTAAVIVLHQAAGMSQQIEDWVAELHGAGYLTIAPHLFHRKGVDRIDPMAEFGGDLERFSNWLEGDDDVLTDISAVLGYLGSRGVPAPSTGVLGFSYGGRAAYLASTMFDIGAGVSYYGNGIARKSYGHNTALPALIDRRLRTPWLGLFGEDDVLLVPGDELDELAAALAGQPVEAELVRYPDAGHGFDLETAPGPAGYHAEAASDAHQRTLDFLATHLAP